VISDSSQDALWDQLKAHQLQSPTNEMAYPKTSPKVRLIFLIFLNLIIRIFPEKKDESILQSLTFYNHRRLYATIGYGYYIIIFFFFVSSLLFFLQFYPFFYQALLLLLYTL
jgi:hypothetical protein